MTIHSVPVPGRRQTPSTPNDTPFEPENIPQKLRALPQWVVYDLVDSVDAATGEVRLDKIPYSPRRTQRRASTTDPTTWGTFGHALAVYRANPKMDGVGFVFTETDPFCGIDFDKCLAGTGEMEPLAAEWIGRLGGYAEVSPSGTGAHVIVEARLSDRGRKNGKLGIEVYDRGRFFTVTGRRLGTASDPVDAQRTVEELYALVSPAPSVEREIRRLRAPALSADEVLRKARTAANGWKFAKLYDRGDWRGLKYPSQSEADFALVNMLNFWAAGDRGLTVELFEDSALYRPPREKGGDYVGRTVDAVLSSYHGPYYDPAHRTEGLREELDPYFRILDAPIPMAGKWPSARKVLAAILLSACEHGSRTEKGVRIGVDVRTLVEVSHVSSKALRYNALPLLVREKLVRSIQRGRGKTGAFLLPLPLIPGNTFISTHNSVLPRITRKTLGNEERKELLRASVGRSSHGTLARVGNSAQVVLEHMVGTPGNRLTVAELAGRTGRLKHNVRATMRRLLGYNLVVEIGPDLYALPSDFWDHWYTVLLESGVIRTENDRLRRHNTDRLLRAGWTLHWQAGVERWINAETGELATRGDALAAVGLTRRSRG
ncbi:MAG: hypothetical protein M3P49_10655 [Actinomycetota bacterium]|nr:hypothetical protein [Actinomycetota bacterium]